MILPMLSIFLTSCQSTITSNSTGFDFPVLYDEFTSSVSTDTKGNVTVVGNENDDMLFFFNNTEKTVTIPLWYWKKLVRYGIDTGGIKQ